MSSGFIFLISVKIGFPMFPPRKQFFPEDFNISYIIDVVVVFPSVPVTPIILQGASFNTISISDVIIAPLLAAVTNSSLVGKTLGDLNTISNPFNLDKLYSPISTSYLYLFIFSIISSDGVFLSNTVTFAFLS